MSTAVPQIASGATHILVGCRRPGCVRTAKQAFPICSRCWGKLPEYVQGDFVRSLNWIRTHPPIRTNTLRAHESTDAERCARAAWRQAFRLWAIEDAQREVAACP